MNFIELRYLLPLPLIVIVFGFGGESLTNSLLSCPYHTKYKLQADTYTLKIQFILNVFISEIKTEVINDKEYTNVRIITTDSPLKRLEFEVSSTDLDSVKREITQELGLSPVVESLQPNVINQIKPEVKVLGILAEIDKDKGITTVTVKSGNYMLKRLEFEFPVTELNQVKTLISKQLGMSREDARMFVSYRIKQ
ncbi:MAG: hypothetical protein IGS39_00190 [Calothrix sp. C42_A2020_038]|nr:hypothetical protein [Calothrix sp. C42_A2020_038]